MPRSRSRPTAERRAAERFGHGGESLAAWLLRLKFYRILTRRYKTPMGEIDLVAEQFGTLVFVEVKRRRRAATELETLEGVNQRRIVNAANHYLMRHPDQVGKPARFDVIFLAPGRWPRHIVNAFSA